jgi:uncharacterized damage-inducible protein DinB
MDRMQTDAERLAGFARAVRESTLKRLRRVPIGRENWRITPGASSFADLASHLVDADEWLFEKLKCKTLAPVVEVRTVGDVDRASYEALLDALADTGARRCALLAGLSAEQFAETMEDARFGAATTVWWIIVRGNLDHEIHHRGQIASYLRVLECGTERSNGA